MSRTTDQTLQPRPAEIDASPGADFDTTHTTTRKARKISRRMVRSSIYIAAALSVAGISATATAIVTGDTFQDPAPTDVSHLVLPNATQAANDALLLEPHVNHGAFEGGATGTFNDTRADTAIPPSAQTGNKIPTGGKPSPLFGAESFTMQALIFEEF
ncbi:MAG: hypothetical protein RLZZ584_4205, partial [Pseudomonadota bacterium]